MIIDMLEGNITQQELLNGYNASITYIKLPSYIDGLVFNYSGINNILINDNMSYYKKRRTILHELAHIELNQLEQADNDLLAFKCANYEDDADNYLQSIKEKINGE